MKITAKVVKFKDSKTNVVGMASITLDDCFVVEDIAIREKDENLYITFPSRKLNKPDKAGKEYKDIVYPITKETRQQIQTIVLAEYNNL